jgi:1-acyl-sn-glycerol-3-phosphate acyltransferase
MLYRILKLIVGLGIRLFYREIHVNNRKNIPSDAPIILIANHPNTLMDAWMIGHICPRPIHFMAKATLFKGKLKMKLLRALNMIPINRVGEGRTSGVSNQDSFKACYEILEEGKTLVIFPEGTSYQERLLRELKSGTARIALEAESRNEGKLGIQVVPIGLNYSQAEKFRSRVLVEIGEPILAKDFLKDYQNNSSQGARKMTEQFGRFAGQFQYQRRTRSHRQNSGHFAIPLYQRRTGGRRKRNEFVEENSRSIG